MALKLIHSKSYIYYLKKKQLKKSNTRSYKSLGSSERSLNSTFFHEKKNKLISKSKYCIVAVLIKIDSLLCFQSLYVSDFIIDGHICSSLKTAFTFLVMQTRGEFRLFYGNTRKYTRVKMFSTLSNIIRVFF